MIEECLVRDPASHFEFSLFKSPTYKFFITKVPIHINLRFYKPEEI